MSKKKAVSIIIFNPDRTEILLIKRRDIPVWVLPGGGIESGESPEDAALREAWEETGYKVRIKRKIAHYHPINKLTAPTFFFECTILSGEATTGKETKDIRFFSLDAFPKNLAPPYPDWIQDALENNPEVLEKKITSTSYKNFFKLLFLHPTLVIRFLLTKIGIHINN